MANATLPVPKLCLYAGIFKRQNISPDINLLIGKADQIELLQALQAEEALQADRAKAKEAKAKEQISSTHRATQQAEKETQDRFADAVLTNAVMNDVLDQYKDHQPVCQRSKVNTNIEQAKGNYMLPHKWKLFCDEEGKFWANIPFTLIYNNKCKRANQYGNVNLTGKFSVSAIET